MKKQAYLFLICYCAVTWADVISNEAYNARERLSSNPNIYDRVDSFCKGKKPKSACVIPGDILAGGGNGICVNSFDDRYSTIDMVCVRKGELLLDRQLPEGGYVADFSFCKDGANREGYPTANCKPLKPPPKDRFCREKSIGSACSVELTYNNKKLTEAGVCKEVVEMTDSYYHYGRHRDARTVIRCEAPSLPERIMTPASWFDKLFM
jgi:hypothetical protein